MTFSSSWFQVEHSKIEPLRPDYLKTVPSETERKFEEEKTESLISDIQEMFYPYFDEITGVGSYSD